MLRVAIVILIVVIGADVILYDGKHTQAAGKVATSIWQAAWR
jgi:hypothetical protein